MKYYSILFTAILTWGCQSKSSSTTEKQRPNIVFIMVDDLGKEWVGCYGAENIETPNIDALAQNGIRFDNVYAMPQCTPTRVTFLTGQYPFRHGWVNHWDVPRWGGGAHFDERKNPSLINKIRDAGYKTCIAGKWQIDDFRVEPDALTRVGFDEYCMWTGRETGIEASGERYQNPYVYTKEGSKSYPNKFGPDVFKDFIIQFIEDNSSEPMFIYYPMVLTHTPFVNTPDEEAPDKLGKHKAMIRYTDKITGEIRDALAKEGLLENTIIVWTTDNGTTGGISNNYKGKAVRGGKGHTIEPGLCVPFIVSWPEKITGAQTSQALIDFTDLAPTFLDLAESPIDDKIMIGTDAYTIDGRSFKQVILGQNPDSQKNWILGIGGGNHAKLSDAGVENQYNFRDRVLRNKQYKLYINSKREAEKFIDLIADPHEEFNLLGSKLNAAQKNSFDFLLDKVKLFPAKDSDPKYIANPNQKWDVPINTESQVWKL